MNDFPVNVHEMVNANLAGFDRAMGVSFVSITPDEAVAELSIGDQHRQPYGLVHGGVYSGLIESVCSTGAALNALAAAKSTVGIENTTSFLRAARAGTLRCVAKPLVKGRRSHVWEASVHDADGRLVATGRVRLLLIDKPPE